MCQTTVFGTEMHNYCADRSREANKMCIVQVKVMNTELVREVDFKAYFKFRS